MMTRNLLGSILKRTKIALDNPDDAVGQEGDENHRVEQRAPSHIDRYAEQRAAASAAKRRRLPPCRQSRARQYGPERSSRRPAPTTPNAPSHSKGSLIGTTSQGNSPHNLRDPRPRGRFITVMRSTDAARPPEQTAHHIDAIGAIRAKVRPDSHSASERMILSTARGSDSSYRSSSSGRIRIPSRGRMCSGVLR